MKTKLESLKSEKFQTLSNESLKYIVGGEETGAGNKLIKVYYKKVPTRPDTNGNTTTEYVTVRIEVYRAWDSDDTDGCFVNERTFEVRA